MQDGGSRTVEGSATAGEQPAAAVTAPQTKERRPVPAWAAGAGAVAFLVLAGGFIYWFLGGSFGGTGDLIPDPDAAQRAAQMQQRGGWRRQPVNADGVRPIPNRGFFVRAGSAYMDVDVPQPAAPGKKQATETTYRFRYDSQALLTPEQFHMVMGLRRVGQDAAMAKTLAIAPEQLKQLRSFGGISMEIWKGDRDKLIAAWGEYDKAAAAAKPAEEKKLVALLKDASNRALPATKARAVERVGDITRILSADQVRELTKLGAGQKVTPIQPHATTPAATAPARKVTAAPTTRPG